MPIQPHGNIISRSIKDGVHDFSDLCQVILFSETFISISFNRVFQDLRKAFVKYRILLHAFVNGLLSAVGNRIGFGSIRMKFFHFISESFLIKNVHQ